MKLPGGVPLRILDEALLSAKEGRLHILQKMHGTLAQARHSVKPQAPKAEFVRYDVDRKAMLIGPRGDMLKYMEELFNVKLDLSTQDGVAYIFGEDAANVAACSKLVQDIAVLVKEGDTVTATVTSVMDYGMVVTINRAQQALLHISDLSHDQALIRKPVASLVRPGQRFNVKVGFLRLSIKCVCRLLYIDNLFQGSLSLLLRMFPRNACPLCFLFRLPRWTRRRA